jgi:phosphoserine aminotransferase
MIARAAANAGTIDSWVERTDWIDNLAVVPETRSRTSVCLSIVDPWFTDLGTEEQGKAAKALAALLEDEGVAYDIGYYRDAPPGLRIWTGATVEQSDIEALLPWLDWAFGELKATYKKAS